MQALHRPTVMEFFPAAGAYLRTSWAVEVNCQLVLGSPDELHLALYGAYRANNWQLSQYALG